MTERLHKPIRALRFVALGVMLAIGVAGVSKVAASTPGQVGSAPRCTVTAVGARGSAFHPSGSNTTVKFKVTGSSNCKVQLSAASFYAPTMNGKPYSKQILYQRVTKNFKPGTYSMTVDLPTKSTPAKGCFYQVDLTYGIHNVQPLIAYGHGKIPNCGQQPKPQPTPQLACQSLTYSVVADTKNTYKFTATATASNTTITKYVFYFGDGSNKTVNTSATTASTTHTYSEADKEYTASVAVSSTNLQNVTSANCKVTVKTPTTPEAPSLVCQNLSFSPVAEKANTYTFTATANASNTTITNYVFSFDDGGSTTVTTSASTATTTHTFANSNQHWASVAVSSKDAQNVTSSTCKVTILGKEQPKVLGETTQLPNTGAGDVVGFFAATSVAGAFIHRYLLRRRIA